MSRSLAVGRGKTHGWSVPIALAVLIIAGVIAAAYGIDQAIERYHDRVALRGLKGKPSPVRVILAEEPLVIPANMIRFRNERRGGELEKVDLLLHWPSLDGFSEDRAADFRKTGTGAPLVFATLTPRADAFDSDRRLDTIYDRFFSGAPFPGPSNLIGRTLDTESGYAGEVVYHAPPGTPPFATRCLAQATPEIPATCIRDVNMGYNLTLRYRFDHALLADWRSMDDRLKRLFGQFFRRP